MTSESTLSEVAALMSKHKLQMRVNLCPSGFHAVVTNEDNYSWSHVAMSLWSAVDGAFSWYLDWESRQ